MENNNDNSWLSIPNEACFSEVNVSANNAYNEKNSNLKESYSCISNYDNNCYYYNKNNNNNNSKNGFLNKKRTILKTEQDYVLEIKRLMKEGGLHEKFIFLEKKKKAKKQNNTNNTNDNSFNNVNNGNDQQVDNNNNIEDSAQEDYPKEKEEIFNENMTVKPIQQTKSLIEWYQKLNLLPYNPSDIRINNKIIQSSSSIPYDDMNEAGYVRFYGMKNNDDINSNSINCSNDDNYKKYYIYLREKNDIELTNYEKKRYEWNVTILCDSYLIGIGLAEKEAVKKNKNQFLSEDENFNNGVYCMINTYNKECNIKEIRPWHCNDKNSVNHVANFPHFKNGRTINIIYHSSNHTLEFNAKKHSYKMINVGAMNNDENENGKKKLSPCVVFYYSGDEVLFSNINCVKIEC